MLQQKKIKILYTILSFGKGGAERFLVDLCSQLKQHNEIEFKIVVLFHDNAYKQLTIDFDIQCLDYLPFKLFGVNENLKYKKILNDFEPDIIHSNLYLAEFITSYHISNKAKYVCHGHDNMIQFKKQNLSTLVQKPFFYYFIERQYLYFKKYLRKRTYFIANSRDTELFYKNNLPKKLNQFVTLIPYGFNYQKFSHKNLRTINVTKKIKLINVGSFQPKKNQKFIIEIALELKKHNIDFEIILIGNGSEFNAVNQLVIDNELKNCITLKGIIDNVEDYYAKSDLYLHTATYEPLGLVFLEAMAAGLPIITLDGKGNRDIMEQGKNGFMFTDQNAKIFAEKIIELAQNQKLYTQISQYNKTYSKQFDIAISTHKLINFYKSILLKD